MIWVLLFVLVAGIVIGASGMAVVHTLASPSPKAIKRACNHPELRITGFNWERHPEHTVEVARLTCTCTACGDLVREWTSVSKHIKDKANANLRQERYRPALEAKGWLYSEESETWLR